MAQLFSLGRHDHPMKRRIKIIIGCLFLFLLGVGCGYLLGLPIRVPASGGPIEPSPNDKLSATAFSWQDSHFLGYNDRTYSEFKIETGSPDPRVIRRVRIEDSAQIPSIDWREDGQVKWATNNSAVTFSYDGPQTSFQMTLKIQP